MSSIDVAGSPGSVEELVARIQRLEDIEAVRALKSEYARRVDDHHQRATDESAAAMAELFTDDAIVDLGPFGRYVGREQLYHAIRHVFTAATAWSAHYILNPVIVVDGSTATGIYHGLVYTQPKSDPPSPILIVHVRYNDKYVKKAAGWKIKEVQAFITPPVGG